MHVINPDGRLRSLRQQMQAGLVKMAGNFCFNKTILHKKHLAALADFFVQINFQEKKNSGATFKKLLFTEIP